MKSMELKGLVAIVTGASTGIGAAIAKTFAQHGASAIINYRRSKDKANQVVQDIQQSGGKAVACQADISDLDDAKRLIQTAVDHFNQVDFLINNAGDDEISGLNDNDPEVINRILDVNLKAVFWCSMAALPHLKKSTNGNIINISSRFGLAPIGNYLPYCVTKAALNNFTIGAAQELQEFGVRVNAIMPLTVDTPLLRRVISNEEIERKREAGDLGTLRDIGKLVMHILRDQTINGELIMDSRVQRILPDIKQPTIVDVETIS